MRGLLVVGASLAAGEQAAGNAVADVLGATHLPALPEFSALASPIVAARHEGTEMDPPAVLEAIRAAGRDGLVVASVPGGMLGALTPRFSVRDLARELWLPIVIAVGASPDLTGLARLNVEAARAAGLAVAAVVVTGWPDPPNRVLLDELSLLDEGAVPVHVIPGAGLLPAEAWLDAAASAPEVRPAAASGTPVTLEPYNAWEGYGLGDPRATPRPRIMAALLEIVAAEGPILADRAFGIYNRAAGGKKLTTTARAPLSSAAYWLSREGKIVLVGSDEAPWQAEDLLRMPDAPPVVVRELGPRPLDEVPLDEIAELMRRLKAARHLPDDPSLKRAVLDTYGLVRLTARADEYLGLAIGLL
jgi:dethiobiotin synthetase